MFFAVGNMASGTNRNMIMTPNPQYQNTCAVDWFFLFTKHCAVCNCECCGSQAQSARPSPTYIEPNHELNFV